MVEHLLEKELSFCLCDAAITVADGGTQWQGILLETLPRFDWTQSSSIFHILKG